MKTPTAIIFSSDYQMQVLGVVQERTVNKAYDKAWEIANDKAEDKVYQDNGIECYDVVVFDSLEEANTWIEEEVFDGRKNTIS